ncbi:hypothetical protein WK91_35850 [Burkholderia cepacia]|uniref:RES family NAD+ phosphorylase n=1 Tax=Burkholderia cepacia TaxID=292 RepID=UPI00075B1E68|nr:RES family NAD+ phosphorylase [Burkholderia cepacia]KVW04399.1 hypothetical protein WK91_35850 [Burkholderia cepacia]
MHEATGNEELTEKRICHECVREEYLAIEIENAAVFGECTYCSGNAPSITIEELADRVDTAFEEHYVRTPDQPNDMEARWAADRESEYDWERRGYPVLESIEDAAGIPNDAANDVLEILQDRYEDLDYDQMGDECEFGPESHYEERRADDRVWQENWYNFSQSLKSEARFFSHAAAEYLAEVFGNIDQDRTRDNRGAVVRAGPKTTIKHLYRARVFQNDTLLEEAMCRPDLHLGPPPTRLARAGRMNAQGISVFYGATSASSAIAEVRPPVGSKVAVAKFILTRPLRLLDLTALEDVHLTGSVFDPAFKRQLERVAFLQRLGVRMTRPVMPDDEALDYLPTQAVADFLATMNEPRLDGIVFASAQTRKGKNVVLFHHASKILELSIPYGTEIVANTATQYEEGWEEDYYVFETIPSEALPTDINSDDELNHVIPTYVDPTSQLDADTREATLAVETESIEVHHVNSVRVNTTSNLVRRYRTAAKSWKF